MSQFKSRSDLFGGLLILIAWVASMSALPGFVVAKLNGNFDPLGVPMSRAELHALAARPAVAALALLALFLFCKGSPHRFMAFVLPGALVAAELWLVYLLWN